MHKIGARLLGKLTTCIDNSLADFQPMMFMVKKFMVEEFMVEMSGVEKSGVEISCNL